MGAHQPPAKRDNDTERRLLDVIGGAAPPLPGSMEDGAVALDRAYATRARTMVGPAPEKG